MDELDRIQEEIFKRKNSQQYIEDTAPAVTVNIPTLVKPVTAPSGFTQVLDEAKVKAVQEASTSDDKFIKEFTEQIKESAKKSAQVEKEKQILEEQNVKYAQELLETQQKLNEAQQKVNDWEKKQKRRQYHYDGVKPIMEFVGVKTPMNLPLLYFLTFILVWFFLAHKLFKGTIGTLLAGAEDENRSKAVKGFLWTLLALIVVAVVVTGAVFLLKWLAII